METKLEKAIGWMLAFCVAVLSTMIILLVFAIFYGANYYGDLMRQCVADGRPEYECYSMIYKGRPVQ